MSTPRYCIIPECLDCPFILAQNGDTSAPAFCKRGTPIISLDSIPENCTLPRWGSKNQEAGE